MVSDDARGGGERRLVRMRTEHLLGELRDREGTVLLRATRRERREADHEEVEAGEGDHVDGELAEVAVELAREAEAARGGRHDRRDEVVEVTEGRRRQLERAEADVVEGLVVKEERLVRVLDQLVDREDAVVRLDDGVRHLRRREDCEGEQGEAEVSGESKIGCGGGKGRKGLAGMRRGRAHPSTCT